MSRTSRQRMSEEQVRRLPVLDADDKLCGIVSLGDLSRETRGEAAHTGARRCQRARRLAPAVGQQEPDS